MVKGVLLALVFVVASCFASASMAEILILPNGHLKAEHLKTQPRKGMSMRQVLKQFGKPVKHLPPIDNPPITRWIYPKYTVYFEDHYVIHTVVHPHGHYGHRP
ncbi:hypothetical protein [Acidihalobacter prosperus]